jgi:hypothetical protein
MTTANYQTRTRDELEKSGTKYELIEIPPAPPGPHAERIPDAVNCINHSVNCCGTSFNICMVPGVWYCCRNGTCRTCYSI